MCGNCDEEMVKKNEKCNCTFCECETVCECSDKCKCEKCDCKVKCKCD